MRGAYTQPLHTALTAQLPKGSPQMVEYRSACLCFWHGLLLAQRELWCAWDGTASCSPPWCWTVPSPEPLSRVAHQEPGCRRCYSPAGGGCFYQHPSSRGFSLISFSSFLQPWICIRSWVRTNLIPGWEHCIRPENPPCQTVSGRGVLALENRTVQGQMAA